MVKAYFKNFLFSLIALVPIVGIIMILFGCGIIRFDNEQLINFLVGFGMMVVGIPTFTYFTEMTIHEIGNEIGQNLAKQKHLLIIVMFAILLGFIFTLAEPDLTFLAEQTPFDTITFVVIVAIGVGIMFILGILRILLNIDLKIVLLLSYAIAFMLCLMIENAWISIPIAFDAGGSVTGSVSVPLILAIGLGISTTIKNKKGNETFGLSGIISIGPLIVVAITFIFMPANAELAEASQAPFIYQNTTGFIDYINGVTTVTPPVYGLDSIANYVLHALQSGAIALSPIVVFYVFYAKVMIKKSWKAIFRTLFGFIFIFIGLILFLAGTSIGFLSVGKYIGGYIAQFDMQNGGFLIFIIMIIVGFIIVFAEPSIKILAHQIEEVSEGSIKSRNMLLVFGVGVSIGLVFSFLRIVYQIPIYYILVPVYIIIFTLMFFIEKKYVGIAFDAGAVCSGTIATAFVLPVASGYSIYFHGGVEGNANLILSTSFGSLAMVAMFPILMVEIVGIQAKLKQKMAYNKARKRVKDENENQVIHFN